MNKLTEQDCTLRNFKLWLERLDSRQTGIALGLATVGFLTYAMVAGDWGDFVHQLHTSRFVYLMSWDFCLMWLVFPALLGDYMARRGLRDEGIFWAVALVPLFGAIAYLCLRPPLPESSSRITFA
ncbi:MAG TPA: hypothetical protein V6C95_01920 [Coleofasciculaceae cyanobacterium]